MKSHGRKIIAPIVVTIVLILYYFVYFGIIIAFLEGFWKVVFGILPLGLSALIVKVCIERIKEIRKGEEDDISKY